MTCPADDVRGLHLVWILGELQPALGPTEIRGWLDQALAKWTAPTPLRARALNAAGMAALMQGEDRAARDYFTACIQIARACGDKLLLADALMRMSLQINTMTELDARERLEQSNGYLAEGIRVARETGHRPSIIIGLALLADNLIQLGRPAEARQLANEGYALSRETVHMNSTCHIIKVLAQCAICDADWSAARAYLEQMHAIARTLSHYVFLYHCLWYKAWVARETGEETLAMRLLEESQTYRRQAHVDVSRTDTQAPGVQAGRSLQLQGDAARALPGIARGHRAVSRAELQRRPVAGSEFHGGAVAQPGRSRRRG